MQGHDEASDFKTLDCEAGDGCKGAGCNEAGDFKTKTNGETIKDEGAGRSWRIKDKEKASQNVNGNRKVGDRCKGAGHNKAGDFKT